MARSAIGMPVKMQKVATSWTWDFWGTNQKLNRGDLSMRPFFKNNSIEG